eukprot:CAMPEP_0172453116 /NCGR_PEP_ID=MMETSP1065-20121228/10584_1 /TAXON_ID=265537 /ORGANISM="Amphiprora paludosa, Strain CCMP125" /LENGTH=55 /DNA_ID=CAMNT_0013205285 /DNA_START=135 /DNA_END=299 /DNA_ORIENTATION=-
MDHNGNCDTNGGLDPSDKNVAAAAQEPTEEEKQMDPNPGESQAATTPPRDEDKMD